MESICRFIPVKNPSKDIKTVHFVLETEHNKLSQPFFRPIYYVHLVTSGNGVMEENGKKFVLEEGTLFFMFPGKTYTVKGTDDFEYIYISFMGSNAKTLMDDFKIVPESPVYKDFSHAVPFWQDAIQRITPVNANILSESVLYYTLSYIQSTSNFSNEKKKNGIESVVEYVDLHYKEPDVSVKTLARLFSYDEKYLSKAFKDKTGTKFTDYINHLRIQYALELVSDNGLSLAEISKLCGFNDVFYFSKVFKKSLGISPSFFKKQKTS